MKMNKRKIFSIIIASIALLLICFSFIDYIGSASLWNTWYLSAGIFQLLIALGLIAVYLLHLFMDLKEKWMKFANYGVGFIVFYHLTQLFFAINMGARTDVGLWFELILALGMGACSVLWYFMSEEPFAPKAGAAPITGYDPATGKPIYAKIKGYDPKTGAPIYEK